MTRILVNVDNASGTLVSAGPINTVQSLVLTRTLDKAGAFSFDVPWTDERALGLLIAPERYVGILKSREGLLTPLLTGIVKKDDGAEISGGLRKKVTGLDIMDELKHLDTGRGLIYRDVTLDNIVSDLVGRVSGWSVDVEDSVSDRVINARFDGVNILKALQTLAINNGLHMRLGTGRELEFGQFGQSNGLRVMKVDRITPETRANDKLLIVDKLTVEQSSFEIINWIEPLGAGEGEATLTLQHSTRGTAQGDLLDIQTMVRNGQTVWYLSLADSISEYGQRTRTKQYADIIPLSNTDGDIVNAANALYDACVADLLRSSVIQRKYGLTVKNEKVNLRPGDKIHVHYKGEVVRDGRPVRYVDINDDFWITQVSERHGQTNSVDLTISNVDRREMTAQGIILDAIAKVNSRGLRPPLTTTPRGYVFDRVISPEYPADVPIDITDSTLYLTRLRLGIKTSPFAATTKIAKEGGDHRHLMFKYVDSVIWVPTSVLLNNFLAREEDNSEQSVSMIGGIVGGGFNTLDTDLYTYEGSGNHSHELEYGVQKDTVTPKGIRIALGGVDLTSALGGPFAVSGGEIDIILDAEVITEALINASGGLRQKHILQITCEDGHGLVEVTVEIFETAQSIKVV